MTISTAEARSAYLHPHGLPARLIKRLRLWHERRRWIGEMANAAALGSLDNILDDVGLTHSELGVLMDGPADAGRQFEALAEMEGIDVGRLPPGVLREAIRACAHCDCRAPCKRWLRTGVWRHDGDPRCPNAALLHH